MAKYGTERSVAKLDTAILIAQADVGCLLVLCIIDTVLLLTTYSLENPPPNITGKAR